MASTNTVNRNNALFTLKKILKLVITKSPWENVGIQLTGMVTCQIWIKPGWDTFLSKEVSNEDYKKWDMGEGIAL